MAQETETKPSFAARRWVKVILVISLALNLAVAGAIAGIALRNAGPDRPPAVRDVGFGPWGGALDRDDRRALRERFAAERDRFTGSWREEREDRKALVAVLRADPFDPSALDALSARLAARGVERMQLGERMIRAHILDMSPKQRAGFADRLEASQRHPGRDHKARQPAEK
ncbi:MAG: periplasmic heavy metal sensor [Gemmobacter sp.]|nr:periplasmic heavy metal sensor [Gemmobacter sp.]